MDESVEKILDNFEAVIIMPISPQNLDKENTNKTLKFKSFSDSRDKILVDFQFLSKLVIVARGVFDQWGNFPTEAFVESVHMVTFDDVAIFFNVFSDSGDSSCFFVVDSFVEHGESVLDF